MRLQLSLNGIITFIAVADARSFRGAAQALHTSQSAVSARIKQLEERLGVRLLDRTTRSVNLTDQGRRLYLTALSACDELSNIEQVLRQEASLERGKVALAVVPSLAQAEIPSIIAEFIRLHPAVELRLFDVDSRRSLEMLVRSEVDLAIISDTIDWSGYSFEPLFWDACYLVVPEAHALARRKKVPLMQLRDVPLMVSPQGTTLRHVLEKAFQQAGLSLEPAQEVSQLPTLVRMVLEGFGVGIAPAKGLTSLDTKGCVLVPFEEKVGWTVGIARAASRSESPASLALRTFVQSHYGRIDRGN